MKRRKKHFSTIFGDLQTSNTCFIGWYPSTHPNNQLNSNSTNDLGSQLRCHRLLPQPPHCGGERRKAGRQGVPNSSWSKTSNQPDWEPDDLQDIHGLLVPGQEQALQLEHFFEADDFPYMESILLHPIHSCSGMKEWCRNEKEGHFYLERKGMALDGRVFIPVIPTPFLHSRHIHARKSHSAVVPVT